MTRSCRGVVAQVERLDRHALDVERVRRRRAVVDQASRRTSASNARGPVVLGAEQQTDQVSGVRHGDLPGSGLRLGESRSRGSTAQRSDGAHEVGQVRVEGVPPADVVVTAGHDGEAHPVPQAVQHPGHPPVVGEVLLVRSAGEHRRHRARRAAAAAHRRRRTARSPGTAGTRSPAGPSRAGSSCRTAGTGRRPRPGTTTGRAATRGRRGSPRRPTVRGGRPAAVSAGTTCSGDAAA